MARLYIELLYLSIIGDKIGTRMLERIRNLGQILRGKPQAETQKVDENRKELSEILKAEYMEGGITPDQYKTQIKALRPKQRS
jgi:hypothetical protein